MSVITTAPAKPLISVVCLVVARSARRPRRAFVPVIARRLSA